MKKWILLFLFFVFSLNTFADCPEYEVNLEHNKHFGKTPNQVGLCSVSLGYDMGWGHYQNITIIYSNPSLLPSIIIDCSEFDKENGLWIGRFIFDDTEVSNDPKEIVKYGIYAIFPSFDLEQVDFELLENSTSLQISKYVEDISFEEIDTETYLYTWDESSVNYSFTEKKNSLTLNKNIEAMKTSITSGNFEVLTKQLSELDYGGIYGAPFNKLPKKFSEKLWLSLHEKTLALYKQGNKKDAAFLVYNILDVVEVSPSEGLYEYLKPHNDDDFWLNYGVDALYENPNLLTAISDCAFFLEQGNLGFEDATAIFTYIVKKYPKRAATYLNLADSLWKLEKFEKAKANYQTYIELLATKNKSNVIPNYVYKRLDRLKKGE